LDLIKYDKQTLSESQGGGGNTSFHHSQSSSGGSSRRYEFHLILNQRGIAERMQLMTKSYDELRLWIVGMNSLISNKNQLMRLSTMIKC